MRLPGLRWPDTQLGIAMGLMLIVSAVPPAGAEHSPGSEGIHATPWSVHIRHMDDALAKKNVSAAERAWHQAYLAALGSRGWEGMLEVGDAYLRIGKVVGSPKIAEAKARRAYLSSLFRARQQRSLDGVLRVAEGFDRLGDQEVVTQCVRIAEGLAEQARDPRAQDRVRAFRERLANRFLAVGPP